MGNLATQNGNGGGSVGLNLRRILDTKSWSELELSAGDGGVGTVRYFRNLGQRMHLQMAGMLQVSVFLCQLEQYARHCYVDTVYSYSLQ